MEKKNNNNTHASGGEFPITNTRLFSNQYIARLVII